MHVRVITQDVHNLTLEASEIQSDCIMRAVKRLAENTCVKCYRIKKKTFYSPTFLHPVLTRIVCDGDKRANPTILQKYDLIQCLPFDAPNSPQISILFFQQTIR